MKAYFTTTYFTYSYLIIRYAIPITGDAGTAYFA